jgi:LmbE family N-acetylglucosaminyl deacetylase
MYYTLAFGALGLPPGPGQIVVDISETLEAKLASVACYKTQFPPEKANVFERIRAFALMQGQAAGFLAGELLASPRVLGTKNLMGVLFG